jgi:hypothetical protein
MMSAKESTEQSNKGHMGQPAACMMDNKGNSPFEFGLD